MSKYLSDNNMHVLTNVISGVESYGQRYSDERRWDAWADAYQNTSNENSITICWPQLFKNNGRDYLKMVLQRDPNTFRSLDKAGIESDLNRSWDGYQPKRGSEKYRSIIAIMTSEIGKKCQDEFFANDTEKYLERAVEYGIPISNPKALMFWVEIEHLGGTKAAKRIFDKCGKNPTTDQIMNALKQDQSDTSSSNQVGDKKFWSRHECCKKWIDQYTEISNKNESEQTNNNKGGGSMSFKKYTNLTDAQIKMIARLCVQEQGGSDAGTRAEASQAANLLETNSTYQKKYGSDICSFMRNSGWYYKAAYFMDNGSANSSQIAAVRDVLVNGNRFFPQYVDEHDCITDIASISTGSKSDRSAYVKGKTVIKNKMGSTYTFYCFPASGCDPFGYTESAYKKVMGGGTTPDPEKTLNETVKYNAYVNTDLLNVRKYAGTEYDLCSFSPLSYQTQIGVCDELKSSNGDTWYYIVYDSKHGFVSAKYISREKPADKPKEESVPVTSGSPQQKVIDIAYNEVGYLEKASNSKLDDKTANAGSANWTKYMRDMFPSLNGMAWCAAFCCWVYSKAFGKDTAKKMCNGLSVDCDEVADNYKSMGRFYKNPQVGDQVLFIKNGNDYYHTGIVVEVTSSTVYTIEGNTSSGSEVIPNGGAVCKKSYAIGNSKIGGYGRPKWDLVPSSADNNTSPSSDASQDSQNDSGGTTLNEAVKYTMYVNNDSVNVRKWAGKEYDTVSFSPLKKGTAVGVSDTLISAKNREWSYIDYNGKRGFILSAYLSKENPNKSDSSANNTSKTTDYITIGAKGEEVKTMQRMLSALGYSCAVDGDFGNATSSALKKFKKDHGMAVNDHYGAKTKEALEKAYKSIPTAKDITVSQLLKACKNVMDTARTKGYHYGDSHATPPCSDKTISCDRLIARALYDLGFKDQRQGGETCGTFDSWLKNHGFVRSTKASAIKKGSILMVKHSGKTYTSHMFVVTAYNKDTWVTSRYDAGSNSFIQSVQPVKNVSWGYRKDDLIVYNIPTQ